MDPRTPPHDIPAEEAVLGACLISREAIRDVAPILSPDDFYAPKNQHLYRSITHLDARGDRVDPVTVGDFLQSEGLLESVGGLEYFHTLQNMVPSISNCSHYGRIVVRHSRLRRLVMTMQDVSEGAFEAGADPDDLLGRAMAMLQDWRLLPRVSAEPENLFKMADFLEAARNEDGGVHRDWVVPNMLRAGWRAVLVGIEGGGKSLLLRQIAAMVANGRHPFALSRRIPAQVTLSIDAENPADVIEHQAGLLDRTASLPLSQDHNWWVWHVEAGLNLTQRADQAKFEKVVEHVRPKLVTLGPAYKLYPVREGEDWSAPTMTFLRFLHEQAVRYGFALIVEHHAPKGANGSRELFPAGASEWLRWPEFGIKLMPSRDTDRQGRPLAYTMGRFRGDRVPATWPLKVARPPEFRQMGGTVPWEGSFPDGTFADETE